MHIQKKVSNNNLVRKANNGEKNDVVFEECQKD